MSVSDSTTSTSSAASAFLPIALTESSVIALVIEYLDKIKSSAAAKDLIKDEAKFLSAIQDIKSAINIADSDAAIAQRASSQIGSLPHIINSGVNQIEHQQATDESTGFKKFQKLLDDKGFFKSAEKDSLAYSARLHAAREKFAQSKKTDKSASAAAPSAASASAPSESELKSKAEAYKTEGNALLAQGQNSAAIEKYTLAIQSYTKAPLGAVLYANRAAAHINSSAFGAALADCQSAIGIDEKYMKAYYRKGQACLQLGQYSAAQQSYEKALTLCTHDQDMTFTIEEQLAEVRMRLQASDGQDEPIDSHAVARTANSDDDDEDDQIDAAGSGAGAAGGPQMPDMNAMLQGMMGGGGGAGPGGFDIASLMQNPAIMQMAQQMFGGSMPDLSALAGGAPGKSNQAQPDTKALKSAGTKGKANQSAPAAPAAAGNKRSKAATSAQAQSLPTPPAGAQDAMAPFLATPAGASLASDPVLQPVLADIKANGAQAMMKYMSDAKVMAKIQGVMPQLMAAMNSKSKK